MFRLAFALSCCNLLDTYLPTQNARGVVFVNIINECSYVHKGNELACREASSFMCRASEFCLRAYDV